MGETVEQMSYDDKDLEKLKYALQGLDPYFQALVWQFAEYLLRLQSSIDIWEASKKG